MVARQRDGIIYISIFKLSGCKIGYCHEMETIRWFKKVVAGYRDNIIIRDIDKNLRGLKMHPCASAPDCVGGVHGQTKRECIILSDRSE